MKKDILKVQDIVENILKDDIRARKNDTWLMTETYRRLGYKIYISYADINTMPKPESISRCRRKLQENGRYKSGHKEDLENEMRGIDTWWNK